MKMLPDHVLIHKMKQDGMKDPEQALKILKGEASPAPASAEAVVVEIPEELQKYVKMMKFLPEHALINKMKQDGVKDVEKALKILKGEPIAASAPKVVEIPEHLKKYVKMMKMLPEHALINKMKQDGIKDADNAMKILKGEAAAPTKKAKPKKPRKKSVSFFLSI
jgi:hypothetical protein